MWKLLWVNMVSERHQPSVSALILVGNVLGSHRQFDSVFAYPRDAVGANVTVTTPQPMPGKVNEASPDQARPQRLGHARFRSRRRR
jgi:hypothetical protein